MMKRPAYSSNQSTIMMLCLLLISFLIACESEENDSNDEINSSGIKIAVVERSAYDLWLTENFKKAELIKVNTIDGSHKLFREGHVDVLAGLKPKLIEELKTNNDFKIISNPFTYIKQAIGIKKGNPEILDFLNEFVSKLIKDGYIEQLLKKHKVQDKLSIPKID